MPAARVIFSYQSYIGHMQRGFPRLQSRYRARLQSILDPDGSDEEHYELLMASQQCILYLATLSDPMTSFLVVRDLEAMFITLAQEQGPCTGREERAIRRRVVYLAGQ